MRISRFLFAGIVVLAMAILGLSLWTRFFFGRVELKQLSFLFFSGEASVMSVDFYWFVWLFTAVVVFPAVAVWGYSRVTSPEVINKILKRPRGVGRAAPAVVSVAVLVFSLIHISETMGVRSAFASSESTQLISDTYRIPDWDAPVEAEKKNLLLIYVESLERSLQDDQLWGEDLVSSLTELTEGWVNPPNFRQAQGARWTIEGVVASQCGIPLRPLAFETTREGEINHNEIGNQTRQFLPGVDCLGDVLADAGYTNTYLGGARKAFASKGDFLSEHGYRTVMGWEDWLQVGETSNTRWGLHDDRLFDYAYSKMAELESLDQPYNLTLLTVDTHLEGLHSETCVEKGVAGLSEIFGCSTGLVAEFLKDIDEAGFLDDTVVVVTGDHLMAPGNLAAEIPEDYERAVFFSLRNPGDEVVRPNLQRDFYHFDIFPTLLDALGFESESKRAGIGLSLFSPDVKSPLEQDMRFPSELMKLDPIWYELWLGSRDPQ